MAQSTTNLGKIHVFPSETLYNQFKDIIADNDLALLKDDGGYIVAALLEQNGYVKFSNGLILQWGYVSHNNVRSDTPKVAVFPISFTKTIYTISTQLHMTNVRPDVGTGPYIVSYSNNQMSIIFNIEHSGVIMDGAWWLVIGK